MCVCVSVEVRMFLRQKGMLQICLIQLLSTMSVYAPLCLPSPECKSCCFINKVVKTKWKDHGPGISSFGERPHAKGTNLYLSDLSKDECLCVNF